MTMTAWFLLKNSSSPHPAPSLSHQSVAAVAIPRARRSAAACQVAVQAQLFLRVQRQASHRVAPVDCMRVSVYCVKKRRERGADGDDGLGWNDGGRPPPRLDHPKTHNATTHLLAGAGSVPNRSSLLPRAGGASSGLARSGWAAPRRGCGAATTTAGPPPPLAVEGGGRAGGRGGGGAGPSPSSPSSCFSFFLVLVFRLANRSFISCRPDAGGGGGEGCGARSGAGGPAAAGPPAPPSPPSPPSACARFFFFAMWSACACEGLEWTPGHSTRVC
jgi:hypothetical protein